MPVPPEVPPGFWARDPSHYPVALTLLFIKSLLRAVADGLRAATEAFSVPLPVRSVFAVDGWEYMGSDGQVDSSPACLAAFEAKVVDGIETAVHRRWWAALRPAAAAASQQLQATDPASLTDAALLGHIAELDEQVRASMTAHFTNGQAAAVFQGRLGLFCEAHLGLTPSEVLGLLAGHSRASRAPAAALEALAARIADDPALAAALAAADAATDPRVRALVQPWLKIYSHRATAFEYNVPTLAEQPERLVGLLRDAVAARHAAGEDADARVRRTREATVAALRARLGDAAQREAFDRLLAEAQAAYEVRDDDMAFVQWGAGLQRRAFLEAGRRLVARRLLTDPEQVWYLHPDEVADALRSAPAPDLLARVTERQAAHARQQASVPPEQFGTPPTPPTLPPLSDAARAWLRAAAWSRDFLLTPAGQQEATAPTELRGAAAARGIYRGTARLVRDESEFDRIQPGDVLVCVMTTSAWNVLFGSVGALVTDEGGILSHPAIIAREFGIPAVVGTRRATATIPDGASVEVDGTAGIVRW